MINQSTKILGTIVGSFAIALPLTTAKSSAIPSVPNPGVNPCPSIYYEEPYNSKLIVPQSCQPNAATQEWLEQGYAPYPQFLIPNQGNFIPSVGGMAPFPLQSNNPEDTNNEIISTIEPVASKVDVKLKNNTNAVIAYQVIAHTKMRYLSGGEEIVLQDIPTPTSITMVREDGGFLNIEPQSTSSDQTTLVLSLDESQKVNDYQGILRIKSNGKVLLN